MRMTYIAILLLMLLPVAAYGQSPIGGTIPASSIPVNTANFTTNLGVTDNTVQKALETLDTAAGGGGLNTAEVEALFVDTVTVTWDTTETGIIKANAVSPGRFADGTVSAPSISFTSDTNTGIYRPGDDNIGFATNAALRGGVNSSGNWYFGGTDGATTVYKGNFAGPVRSQITDTEGFRGFFVDCDTNATTLLNLGSYNIMGRNSIGAVRTYGQLSARIATNTDGTERGQLNLNAMTNGILNTQAIVNSYGGLSVGTSSVDNAGSSYGLYVAGKYRANDAIIGSAGTAALPQYTFISDTDTGMYHVTNDVIGFANNATLTVALAATGSRFYQPILAADGSAATPSYHFANDANTGIYSAAADTIGLSTGGTLRLSLSTTALTSTLPVLAPAGTAAAPSVTFSGDPDTGVYSAGTNILGIATNGTARALVNASGNMSVAATDIAGADYKLAVGGDMAMRRDSFSRLYLQTYYAGDRFPVLQFEKSRNGTIGSHTIAANNEAVGIVRFAGSNGATFDITADIRSYVDGTPGATADMPGRLEFYTTPDGSATPVSRMRINNAGNMTLGATDLAGTTASSPKLYVNGTCSVAIMTPNAGGANVYWDSGDKKLYVSTSDRAVKQDIQPLAFDLDKYKAIEPVSYEEKGKAGQRFIGFVANDLESIVPELVYDIDQSYNVEEDDGVDEDGNAKTKTVRVEVEPLKAVRYSQATALNTAAIQALIARIEALEARVAELEAK